MERIESGLVWSMKRVSEFHRSSRRVRSKLLVLVVLEYTDVHLYLEEYEIPNGWPWQFQNQGTSAGSQYFFRWETVVERVSGDFHGIFI